MSRGAALALLGILALTCPAHAQLLSPGKLARGHAAIDTDDDCAKCHESGRKVVARLCLACHQDLGAALSAGRGLHGRQYKAQPCEHCHVEHLGRKGRLVRWPGGAMEKLDHALTGYRLEGKHATVTCLACHTKRSATGATQFVGTKDACAACHKDPHDGRFTATCQKCHNATDWKAFERKAFNHQLTKYPLTGKHVAVACEGCHVGAPPKWKPLGFATCDACHEDPHRGQFRPKPCTSCHDTSAWDTGRDKIRSNHPGLSLAAGHARVDCKACHDRGNDRAPSKGKACVACHKAVHLASFGPRCERCHASIRWVGLAPSIGRDHHDETRYRLQGAHQAIACDRCHPSTRPVAQRFRGLAFGKCASCHADPHAGEFAARDRGECAACHTVAGFAPTTFGVTAHATTGFALDGKHLATPCSGCHPAPRPRLTFRQPKRACAECHDDPHGAQFAAEMAKGGCATCHSTLDWREPKIDHATWPLLGAHARATCAGCHGAQRGGAQPAAYRGIPRDCEGCHEDLHAGQFVQSEPVRRCERCHTAMTFQIARTFPHQETRFPLLGKHRALECSACHRAEALRNGASAVRWRLGYSQCKDCHANPHREEKERRP
ncbi:MAG: hypothetical protein R3B48_18115 [Kofleriaceae bacterium]